MKRFLLALALIGAAHAGTVATMKNNAGGMIVLTDARCDKKSLVVYANSDTGKTMFGCWFVDDNFVFIRWNDGEIKTYPFGDWTYKAKSYD